MKVQTTEKNIDRSKLNIGTELECFIVYSDSLQLIDRSDSQAVMKAIAERFQWEMETQPHNGEVQVLTKFVNGLPFILTYDASYALFEFASPPVSELDVLEAMHKQVLEELRTVLREFGMMIWPFEVAPASNGLLRLPFQTRTEIVQNNLYNILARKDDIERLCNVASHQVSLDVPLPKLIPTINALYKNSGDIIAKFANAPVYANNMLYKAGRYYWINDCSPELKTPRYSYGATHIFPDHEFKDINDFFSWIWQAGTAFVVREGIPYMFTDSTAPRHKFLRERKAQALNLENTPVEVELQKEDIEVFFVSYWMDFKAHFDFDQSYTIEEFLQYYEDKNLDGFFEKYCKHTWLEIRACAPHFENNAMDIPRYFYAIFSNLDQYYIDESRKISWEEALEKRKKAIGYI